MSIAVETHAEDFYTISIPTECGPNWRQSVLLYFAGQS
jgi:hypothetical protein